MKAVKVSPHIRIAVLTTAALLFATPSLAQDVTRPGDAIIGSSINHPGGEAPQFVIDNSAASKYLNFDELNTGFTVTPTGAGIVRALCIITANDSPERDPTSFTLEGSDDGVNFTQFASGTLTPNTARFSIAQTSFANATSYVTYRVLFPTVRNAAAANSMQVAEVQLSTNLNVLSAGDPFVTTLPPGASSIATETAANLFDTRLSTKFGITGGDLGPTTVDVIPGAGSSTVSGIEIYGGNDDLAFPNRTPSSITLSGSNDGVNYVQLFTSPVDQVTANYQSRQFEFSNSTSYSRYRIQFGASIANYTQIGEIRLMGTLLSSPPSNDTCAAATNVVAGATSGNNFNATGSITSPCGNNDTLDVFYNYRAPNSGPVEINTFGPGDLDTTLSITDGCAGSVIACNDNARGGKSRISFNAIANRNYKIRVAGHNASTGGFTMNIIENPVTHNDVSVSLACNFNGMVHNGEAGLPDELNGYRGISDRGLVVSGAVGAIDVGLEGLTGIPYTVVTAANQLDMIHIGDRNQVDNFNHSFDFDVDFDEIGIQPSWLPDSNQTGPQTSNCSATMGADTQIGLLYNASNNGNNFDVTLGFASGDPVTVRLNAPDWFGEQQPTPPGPGVAQQTMLNTYFGAQEVDMGTEGTPLNVVESIITTASLGLAGSDVLNRQLTSITFSNADTTVSGIGIYAVTIRDAGASCPADFNGDTVVDFFDYLDFVQAFSANEPIADFNGDTVIDFFDYLDFVQAFSAGC